MKREDLTAKYVLLDVMIDDGKIHGCKDYLQKNVFDEFNQNLGKIQRIVRFDNQPGNYAVVKDRLIRIERTQNEYEGLEDKIIRKLEEGYRIG